MAQYDANVDGAALLNCSKRTTPASIELPVDALNQSNLMIDIDDLLIIKMVKKLKSIAHSTSTGICTP